MKKHVLSFLIYPFISISQHRTGRGHFAAAFLLLSLLLQLHPLNYSLAQGMYPEWRWAKQAGGPAADRASSVTATYGGGVIYQAGTFNGTATFGSTNLTSRGGEDIFISRYNADGNLLWTKQIGGTAADRAAKTVTDGSGNLYIAGVFSGTADFGGTSLTSSGSLDAFLAKFDAAGSLQWVRQAGAASTDGVQELAIDISENLHFAVRSEVAGGGGVPSSNSVFIYKYSSSGGLEWSVDAGGVGGEANAVAFDEYGNTFAAGQFTSSVTFGDITLTATTAVPSLMLNHIFTVKYSTSGEAQWAQKGTVTDGGVGAIAGPITVDNSGNVYVVGYYDLDIRFGDIELPYGGFVNACLVKYNDAGDLQWAKVAESNNYSIRIIDLIAREQELFLAYNYRGSLGSPSNQHVRFEKYDTAGNVTLAFEEQAEPDNASEYEEALPASGVFVDADGRIYITFSFFGTAYITGTTGNFEDTEPITSDDFSNLFTAIYSAEGKPLWVQQVETTAIADAPDGVYMAGSFEESANFGTASLTSSGGTDAFLAKVAFSALANPYCVPVMASGCADDHFIAYFSFAGLYYNALGQGCRNDNSYTSFYPFDDKNNQSYYEATVKPGQSYPISLRSESEYGDVAQEQAYGVWIDYNDDKDFDDPGEFVYSSPSVGAAFTGNVLIPADASLGVRRLRVRSRPEGVFTASEACTAGAYGETQDYTISVGYCAPFPYAQTNNGSYIDNFSFHTLENNNSGFTSPGYTLYEPTGSLTTTVTKGQSYNLSVQSGPVAQAFGVWIDYNNDLDFDDAGELVYASPVTGEDYIEGGTVYSPSVSTALFTGTVLIPASAASGQLRLRVRSNSFPFLGGGGACAAYDSDPAGPDSDSFLYGETEDYTITVEGAAAPPPVLASFSPRQGLPGAAVVLRGTALGTASSVQFNGVDASFMVISDTELRAVVPVSATTGEIRVVTDGGEASSDRNFVVMQPEIYVFAPWWGYAGTQVYIVGRYLSSTSEVRFNGAVSPSVRVYNDYLLRAVVPAGATSGAIVVSLTGGAVAESPWDFRVLGGSAALVASREEADKSLLSAEIAAYPNPFQNDVTIVANLPEDSPVRLVIYSETGQQVREISFEQLGAGRQRLHWDGRSSQGQPVAQGLYLYRVLLPTGQFSGKLIKSASGGR